VKHIDEQFGRIMSKVDALGLKKNTVVVFTTDHGVALPRAKASLYNAGTNVALIAQAPGTAWKQGTVHKELISHIDVLPSILELLGLPVPDAVQGRSFVPLVEGGTYEKNHALFTELTYHQYYDPMRAIRTERHKLIAFFSSAPAFMEPGQRRRPLTDPWDAPTKGGIGFHEDVELFDLEQDPWEMNNIVKDEAYTHIKQDLMARLYNQMLATDDPLLNGAVPCPQHEKVLGQLAICSEGGQSQADSKDDA
jgi:arylsulfatase A-like enzyme